MAILQTSGAGVFTPEGFAEALEEFGREAPRAVLRGMSRAKSEVKGIAVAYFRREGVGKGIFGKKASGAFKLISVSVRMKGPVFTMRLSASGFAALQDQGGRTKPHIIKPLNRKALRFSVPGGIAFSRIGVRHPGANVPRRPFLLRALERARPRVQAEIEKELHALVRKRLRSVAA